MPNYLKNRFSLLNCTVLTFKHIHKLHLQISIKRSGVDNAVCESVLPSNAPKVHVFKAIHQPGEQQGEANLCRLGANSGPESTRHVAIRRVITANFTLYRPHTREASMRG